MDLRAGTEEIRFIKYDETLEECLDAVKLLHVYWLTMDKLKLKTTENIVDLGMVLARLNGHLDDGTDIIGGLIDKLKEYKESYKSRIKLHQPTGDIIQDNKLKDARDTLYNGLCRILYLYYMT